MSVNPRVSVTIVTYNHERYISDAISSVLNQSIADWELVVVNDGSTDATAQRIGQFSDPRIRVIHQQNGGPSVAANRAIRESRGHYIALFTGDDVCHPDRVRRQLAEYERGSHRVLFSQCDFIDEDGQPLTDKHFAEQTFDFTNRSRAQILARFFQRGNYFNGVTAFSERAVFLESPFDPTLLQLQDFDVWLKLVKKHEIQIMPHRLLSYRVRASGGNLSSPTPDRMTRLANESYLILRRFFDNCEPELFREAFGDKLRNREFTSQVEFACEQAFLYCQSAATPARLIGIERLHELLNDPVASAVLSSVYGFTVHDYFELMRRVECTRLPGSDIARLFIDTGNGWDVDGSLSQYVDAVAGPFVIEYQLRQPTRVQLMRWDPVELRSGHIRIDAIEMWDGSGRCRVVDLGSISANGSQTADGTVTFETADPQFWWSVESDVSQVTIRGHWECDDHAKTIVNQSLWQNRMMAEIADLRRELNTMRASRSWRLTSPMRKARNALKRLKAG